MTDLTTVTRLATNASDLVYDAVTQTCYYSVGNKVYSFDPMTGKSALLMTAPGTIGSLAIAPDGSHMLIGLTAIFAATPDDYQGTVIDITLATANDPTTYVTRHYHTDNSYLPGRTETGVFDLLITPGNEVMMTEEFDGSGWVPLHIYPLDSPEIVPGTLITDHVRMETTLISSENGRYVFIEEGNISDASMSLYDTQTHQIIASGDSYNFGQFDTFNRGAGDVSEAAGLIVDVAGRQIYILDFSLHLVKNLAPELGFNFADAKFSQDGKLLYLWQVSTKTLKIYDTATWTYQGHVDVDVGTFPSRFNSSGAGHMTLSDDGRFMFLLGEGKLDSVDLLAHTHYEQQGTAADDTLNSGLYGDYLYGKAGNDHLVGNAGDDHLSGGDGNDILDGGSGSDSAFYDTATDSVSVDLTIVGGQQTGQGKDTLIGMEGIVGSKYNDFLTGDSHDNYLDGGAGVDILSGGLGDDTYVIDDLTDVIIEHRGGGNDTIITSLTYTLPSDIENLTISGYNGDGTGNSANNILTGNAGSNRLDGGAGADIMIGGAEGDYYKVDNVHDVIREYRNEGMDTVTASVDYTLSSNIEILDLTGAAITGRGNGEDNVIVGTDANNVLYGLGGDDDLDGGKGADVMSGGTGHDLFHVDDIGDVVIEDAGGYGTVYSFVSFTMGANVEVVSAYGPNLTLIGNSDDNFIYNYYNGYIDGGAGADTMESSYGTATYVVDNVGDVITDQEAGDHDLVLSSISFTLTYNLEDLSLSGADALNGTGNELDNILTGNGSNNILSGADGNDTLNGNGGLDTLTGGTGDDVYIIDVSGDIVSENADEGHDSEMVSISYAMDANVEVLTLTGSGDIDGTGNELANVITGNAGNNRMDGGLGADVLSGGGGDDIYIVDSVNDQVMEDAAAGQDTVMASVSYTLGGDVENLTLIGTNKITATGNGLDNVITGNDVRNTLTGGDGNDTLMGGKGIDTMIGGAGNDTYYVDNVAEIVTEQHGGGSDTVYSSSTFTLSADIEKLILTGTGNTIATGNAGNNTLIGNDGNNKLLGGDGADTLGGGLGNDTLDGGSGLDTMKGGSGDDKYYLDTSADVVTEFSNGGTDTVQINGTYTLTANVENLIIVGSSNRFGTGNALDNHITGNAGNNTLGGAEGNDIIDGGKGADLMRGGTGDDIFYVDNSGDVVSEYSHAGTDSVFSSVSFTLGGNVENLSLNGKGNLSATGNGLDNILAGNAGDNLLTGGKGADSFVFAVNSGADTISDFSAVQGDTIDLSAHNHGVINLAMLSQSGSDTVIDLGGGMSVTVLAATATDPGLLSHIIW